MKLIIDRSIWLRGEGSSRSRLLRGIDGKMCCVGQYLEQCGMARETLREYQDVTDLKDLPAEAAWLHTNASYINSVDASYLYGFNDDYNLSEERRESEVRRIFAQHGVEVEFKEATKETK